MSVIECLCCVNMIYGYRQYTDVVLQMWLYLIIDVMIIGIIISWNVYYSIQNLARLYIITYICASCWMSDKRQNSHLSSRNSFRILRIISGILYQERRYVYLSVQQAIYYFCLKNFSYTYENGHPFEILVYRKPYWQHTGYTSRAFISQYAFVLIIIFPY